jgi:spermidine synthase
MRLNIFFALFLRGFGALIFQVLILRELLVVYLGNELSFGLILANWLFWEAIGASFFSRLFSKVKAKKNLFAFWQILLGLALPVCIYAARTSKGLFGLSPAQTPGLWFIFYSSWLVLAIPCLIDGLLFALGSALTAEKGEKAVAKVYLLEALGAACGGVCFGILIQRFSSLNIVFFLSLLNLASCAFLTLGQPKTLGRGPGLLALFCIFSIGMLFYSGKIEKINRLALEKKWPGYSLLEETNSIYANLAVLKKDQQVSFLVNGISLYNLPYPDIAANEELAHIVLGAHRAPEKILLLATGPGGIIGELLKHPLEQITYVELDPALIKMIERYSPDPETTKELHHAKLKVNYLDLRLFLEKTEEKFDLIILGLPAPSSLQINRMYSDEFFQLVKKRLNRGGIFVLGLPGNLNYLNQGLRLLNRSLLETLKKNLPYLKVLPGETNLFLASASEEILKIDAVLIWQRLSDLKIPLRFLTLDYLQEKFSQTHLKNYFAFLAKSQSQLNRDFHPLALFYHLLYESSRDFPLWQKILFALKNFSLLQLAAILLVIIMIFLYLSRKNLASASLSISLAASGFLAMAFNLVTIFSFQIAFGYLYFWLSFLNANFMAALAAGAFFANRQELNFKAAKKLLLAMEAGLCFLLAGFIFALAFGKSFLLTKSFFFAFAFLAGLFNGANFALVAKLKFYYRNKLLAVAGETYALDLCGGIFAAVFTAVILLPLLGVWQTCLFLILLKAISFCGLFFLLQPLG